MLSCKSPGTAIAIPRASRPYRLARWFAGRSPTYHGPATHGRQSPVRALSHTFLQFIWHGNRHSTGLQGILARAMALICVHRAPRTPPDSTPGHIRPRDDILMNFARGLKYFFSSSSERCVLWIFAALNGAFRPRPRGFPLRSFSWVILHNCSLLCMVCLVV